MRTPAARLVPLGDTCPSCSFSMCAGSKPESPTEACGWYPFHSGGGMGMVTGLRDLAEACALVWRLQGAGEAAEEEEAEEPHGRGRVLHLPGQVALHPRPGPARAPLPPS